jgi:acyl-CoA synthetase (AMP-forming)/AMP-acid ligase II
MKVQLSHRQRQEPNMPLSHRQNAKILDAKTFVDILFMHAEACPDNRAYTFLRNGEEEEAFLTFSQLNKQARAIAAHLQSLDMAGKPVLLSFPPGLEFIAAFFGCLCAGVIAVPVVPPRRNHHDDRIKEIIGDAGASLILTAFSLINELNSHLSTQPELSHVQTLVTEYADADTNALAAQWENPAVDENTSAFLQYTSGSTGIPKGVIVSHGNLVHNERMAQSAFGHDENTVFTGWLPMHHDMGLIGNVLQPLYLGIHCVLMPPVAFVQQPIRWLRTISRYHATTSGAPNFAYDLCVSRTTVEQREGLDLSSWCVAFNGAEPVRAEVMERFASTFAPYGFKRQAFYPCYGMAEATLFITGGNPQSGPTICKVDAKALEQHRAVVRHDGDDPNGEGIRTIVGCGHAWHDQRTLVVNVETRTECAEGIVGEIWLSGGSVAKGYWNNPAKSRETFQAYLADGSAGPFLRTGDLGFLLNGELFITGRLKDVIIIKGRNHYPQDIETTVANSHSSFRHGRGAAFTVEVNGEERLVIVQEIERSWLRKIDSTELTPVIREAVANNHGLHVYKVGLIRPATIPKTTSDKIRRNLCRSMLLEGRFALIGDGGQEHDKVVNDRSATI